MKAVFIGVFGLGLMIVVALFLGSITPKATGSVSECGSGSWKYEC